MKFEKLSRMQTIIILNAFLYSDDKTSYKLTCKNGSNMEVMIEDFLNLIYKDGSDEFSFENFTLISEKDQYVFDVNLIW
jgi:hypothetical protein